MPSVVAQTQGEACARLKAFAMTCRATIGAPATGTNQPGMVYQQTPAAGTVATAGTRAALVYYSGTGTTHDYAGQNIDAACAQVQADGFACTRREGVTAAGTGQQPNTVYQQNPPPNTKRDIKQPVTLTYYSPTNTLPSYAGGAPDTACADITARGFTCKRIEEPAPSTNVVQAQDQPAATTRSAPRSGSTTRRGRSSTTTSTSTTPCHVWALRPKGNIPAGFGRPADPRRLRVQAG